MKSKPETEKIFVKHVSDKLLICKICVCVCIHTYENNPIFLMEENMNTLPKTYG